MADERADGRGDREDRPQWVTMRTADGAPVRVRADRYRDAIDDELCERIAGPPGTSFACDVAMRAVAERLQRDDERTELLDTIAELGAIPGDLDAHIADVCSRAERDAEQDLGQAHAPVDSLRPSGGAVAEGIGGRDGSS